MKAGLKFNIQKAKIRKSNPITSWQIDRENIETVTDFIFFGSKSLWMVAAVTKLKDTCSLDESEVEVAQPYLTLCNPMNCSLPGSTIGGILQARILECSSALLLWIFPTQGLNPRLLHCRWILNHLSHQGSPTMTNLGSKKIKKQRHHFANKGLHSQSYGFSSSPMRCGVGPQRRVSAKELMLLNCASAEDS